MADTPPMTNCQRQRRFRAAHPGYFRKYSAIKTAQRKAAEIAVRRRCAAIAEQAAYAREMPLFALARQEAADRAAQAQAPAAEPGLFTPA